MSTPVKGSCDEPLAMVVVVEAFDVMAAVNGSTELPFGIVLDAATFGGTVVEVAAGRVVVVVVVDVVLVVVVDVVLVVVVDVLVVVVVVGGMQPKVRWVTPDTYVHGAGPMSESACT